MGLNALLRKERMLRAWSLDDVADRLAAAAVDLQEPAPKIDGHSVGRYERRERRPRPQFVRLFAHAFQKSPADLGFIDELGANEDVRRRTLLKGLAGLATVSMVPDQEALERLLRVLERPGTADARTVDHLEQATIALGRFYQDVRPSAVLGPANGHLNTITTLLDGSLRPSLRQRLCSLAGETTALLGWLRWNLDDLDGASRYFRAGLAAAREGDDDALGAYLVGCIACRPFYREDPNARLRLLEGSSHGYSPADATPATQAWLANLESGGYALLGDFDRYAAAADRAAELLAGPDADEGDRRPRLTTFDPAYFAEEQAACLLRLSRPADAQRVLDGGLAEATGRIRLWMLVDLACANAAMDAPEPAAAAAEEALLGAWDAGVEPVLHCVRDLLEGELQPYRSLPTIQELEERVRSVAG